MSFSIPNVYLKELYKITLLLKKIMNSHVKHIFTMQIETRQDFKMTPIYGQSHYI